jgi:hypothetical protein
MEGEANILIGDDNMSLCKTMSFRNYLDLRMENT